MKTFSICILVATIATSDALFLSGLFAQKSEPQELLHHHHHHHEVIHKSIGVEHHSAVHPQHVQVFKIIHEQAPAHHGGHGYAIEEEHGPVYHQAPAHVITKVVQPVVHKNFIHNQHEHYYHHASAPAHHHGWN